MWHNLRLSDHTQSYLAGGDDTGVGVVSPFFLRATVKFIR